MNRQTIIQIRSTKTRQSLVGIVTVEKEIFYMVLYCIEMCGIVFYGRGEKQRREEDKSMCKIAQRNEDRGLVGDTHTAKRTPDNPSSDKESEVQRHITNKDIT